MISIIYLSNRKECKFEWFAASFRNQFSETSGEQFEIIFVDFYKEERSVGYETLIPTFIPFKHVLPLPSLVQGKHKITSKNYFSASCARNAGIVHATGDYIMYVDDLSILAPTWLSGVIESAKTRCVLEGAYRKDKNMLIENGLLISSEVEGEDSRWKMCGDGRNKGYASWLFGCSVGMPLDTALQVNGWDNICDCMGYEDCLMGLQLQKLTNDFVYDKNVLTIESSEHHFLEGNYFIRQDPQTTKENYFEILSRYGVYSSTYHNLKEYNQSHAVMDLTKQLPVGAVGNKFSLRELRDKVIAGAELTIDDMKYDEIHWFTGKHLSEC